MIHVMSIDIDVDLSFKLFPYFSKDFLILLFFLVFDVCFHVRVVRTFSMQGITKLEYTYNKKERIKILLINCLASNVKDHMNNWVTYKKCEKWIWTLHLF